MSSKVFKYNVPIYFGRLEVVVSTDFKKDFDKFGVFTNLDVSNYQAFTFKEVNKAGIEKYIVFVAKETTPQVIAHEAVHIANFIFDSINATPDLKNDEPYAYLVGWVVSRIHKSIKKL